MWGRPARLAASAPAQFRIVLPITTSAPVSSTILASARLALATSYAAQRTRRQGDREPVLAQALYQQIWTLAAAPRRSHSGPSSGRTTWTSCPRWLRASMHSTVDRSAPPRGHLLTAATDRTRTTRSFLERRGLRKGHA